MTTIRHSRLLAPLLTFLLLPVTAAARADEAGSRSVAVGGGETLSVELASHRSHSYRCRGRYDHRRGHHRRHHGHHWRHRDRHHRDYRHDHGYRRHGPYYRGHGRYYGGRRHHHFEIPRIIHRHHRHYRDYYYGQVYYRGHRHYHDVYRFPVYSGYEVDYRPYAYCDGGFFASGYFGHHGPVFGFRIRF